MNHLKTMGFSPSNKLALALGMLMLAPLSQAETIVFSNTPASLSGGNNMGIAWQAEAFNLGATERLTSIRFWTLEVLGEYRGSISWQITDNTSGTPGSTVYAGVDGFTEAIRTATGNTANLYGSAYEEYAYSINFSPLALNAGDYWLTLHNGSLANLDDPNDFLWSWTAGVLPTTGMESYNSGSLWETNSMSHAFEIVALPEPGSLELLAIGLAVYWARLRLAKSPARRQGKKSTLQEGRVK